MISSFGISLAAGIVIEVFKSNFPINITQQIENAFDEAINKCVKNDEITKRTYKRQLKEIIKVNYNQNPNTNLKDKSITGLHAKFFIEFEIALIKRELAYNYIKEARDDSRFHELKDGQEDIKQGVDEIKEQLVNFITQSNNTGALKNEYIRQLEQYQENLEDFNPSIALKNLLALEESFAKNSFSPDDIMKSNIELLKAKCFSFQSGKKNDTLTSYIKAYCLNKNSNEAKQLAAYAYFETGNKQKAKEIVEELILNDSYNPIAWAIKTVITDNDSLSEILSCIPNIVIDNTTFKRFLFICSIASKQFKDLNVAFDTFNVLLNVSNYDNSKLTYYNYKERVFLVESIIREFSKELFISFFKEENNKDIIDKYHKILGDFLDGIKKSELDSFYEVKFLYAYFDYILSGRKESVYLMKDLYKKIDNNYDFYLPLASNSLQQVGDFDGAIYLLNKNENKSEALLFLEMYCWQQKRNFSEYVKTTKQYLRKTTKISIIDSDKLFSIIDYLKSIQKINEFEIDEFIKEKEFEPNCLKTLFEEYVVVIKEKAIDKTLENLANIKHEILSFTNSLIIYRLAKLYYTLKEFEEAFNILDKVVDKDIESEELYFLILSLYHGKFKQSRLKQLVSNLSFASMITY